MFWLQRLKLKLGKGWGQNVNESFPKVQMQQHVCVGSNCVAVGQTFLLPVNRNVWQTVEAMGHYQTCQHTYNLVTSRTHAHMSQISKLLKLDQYLNNDTLRWTRADLCLNV